MDAFDRIEHAADEAMFEVLQADLIVPLAFTNRYLDGEDLSLVMCDVRDVHLDMNVSQGAVSC